MHEASKDVYTDSIVHVHCVLMTIVFSDLVYGCSLQNDRVQKSGISETTAQQLALCNSFCINRVRQINIATYLKQLYQIFLQVFSGT